MARGPCDRVEHLVNIGGDQIMRWTGIGILSLSLVPPLCLMAAAQDRENGSGRAVPDPIDRERGGRIIGSVKDATTKKPIAGAKVVAEPVEENLLIGQIPTTRSQPDGGRFMLDGVAPGVYNMLLIDVPECTGPRLSRSKAFAFVPAAIQTRTSR